MLAGMFVWIVNTINVQSDLSHFLPRQQTFVHKLLINQLNQGGAARTLFITVSSGEVDERVKMSQQLAERLKSSGFFELVLNGEQKLSERDIDLLLRYRYLLSSQVREGFLSFDLLNEALKNRLKELSLPVPVLDKQYLPKDPTVELRNILSLLNKKNTIPKEQGVWVDTVNEQAILVARTHEAAVDLDRQQEVIDFITSSFSELNTSHNLKIQLTGLAAASVSSRKIIQAEARWFSVIATVALLMFLFAGFRSGKLVLISALPMLSAILTGLFVVLLWFKSIHGITLVFAMTILGMAIDYPLHFFSHLGQEQSAQKNIKKIWGTMLVGLVTTMVAFLTLVFSNFDGLYQLGLFTSSGLLMAALTTRFILPALVGTSMPKFRGELRLDLFSKSVATAIVGMSVTFIVVSYSWQLPKLEQSLRSLSPLPETYNQRDHQLRETLGVSDLGFVVLVSGDSVEEVLQKSELLRPRLDQLVESNRIEAYEMAAQYLPSQARQNQRKQYLPKGPELSQTLSQLLQELPFKADLFQPFLEDVDTSKELKPLVLGDLKGVIFEPMVSSLLLNLSGRYYGVINITGKAGVEDIEQNLQAVESNGPQVDVMVYNLKSISTDLMNQFYADFLKRIFMGVLLIILILLVVLKNISRALVVVSVLFLSLSLEVAWLTILGHDFTLFHLVSLILVFGLGLDYALFFTRKEAVADRQKTVYGLLMCLVSSMLVFGILSFSSIPVLHIIGLTTAMGVFLAFFFSLLISSMLARD